MTTFQDNEQFSPILAECYKEFVDLLAKLQANDIQLCIENNFSVDHKLGPAKTTKLSLHEIDSGTELDVIAVKRAFPISRCDYHSFIESDDHHPNAISFAAVSCMRFVEDGRNILDCTMRELLGYNYEARNYIEESYQKSNESASE